MLNFFKKRKETKKMTTLDEVRKAYEDLSEDDKKSFHQSIADRVHESIGEQEAEHGDKDSQSAADREHEALGAEHADGEGEVTELHDTDGDGDTDKTVVHHEGGADVNAQILETLKLINEKLTTPKAEAEAKDKLDGKREKYGMSGSYAGEGRSKEYSDDEIRKLLKT